MVQEEEGRWKKALASSDLASHQFYQHVKTHGVGGVGPYLPSYGQAHHTARGHGCCPGCTGSYSQPGYGPAGASPQGTSFQNRCGFWN